MKRLFVFLLIILFPLLFFAPKTFAKVVTKEKGVVTVAKNEIINDDLFIAGESVEIYGTVNGDVYAAGGSVKIDGVINGDLHAGGGSIYVGGKIREDVYIGGGNVNLTNAIVGDSLIIGAGNVSIDKYSSIGGSLIAGAGTLTLESSVKRSAMLGVGNADINSQISGEVKIGAGAISLGPNTKIGKDLYYAIEDGTEINISEGATVSGNIQKLDARYVRPKGFEQVRAGMGSAIKSAKFGMSLFSFLGALLVGYLCLRFLPKVFVSSSDLVSKSFFKSLGVGFVLSLVFIPALIVLAITIIGLPLAGIFLLLFILNVYLTKIVVGLAFGNWIKDKFGWKNTSQFAAFVLGLLGIYFLKEIVIIGFFVSLIVLWVGLGSLLLYYQSILSPKK